MKLGSVRSSQGREVCKIANIARNRVTVNRISRKQNLILTFARILNTERFRFQPTLLL